MTSKIIIIFCLFVLAFFSIEAQDNTQLKAQRKAMERRLELLQKGKEKAPDFRLKNLTGNYYSLSDFRGKWVVIDFWSTKNPLCYKDFRPLLKKYEDNSEDLQIIGVFNNDSETKLKETLTIYDLPWINLYNTGENSILNDYAVPGFPTKVIVNPQGIIKYVSVGNDPDFFEVLDEFLYKDDAKEERIRKNLDYLIGF